MVQWPEIIIKEILRPLPTGRGGSTTAMRTSVAVISQRGWGNGAVLSWWYGKVIIIGLSPQWYGGRPLGGITRALLTPQIILPRA